MTYYTDSLDATTKAAQDAARAAAVNKPAIDAAKAAAVAAQQAAADSATAATAAQSSAAESLSAAQNAANLVGAPAGTAIDTYINSGASVAARKGDVVYYAKDYGVVSNGTTDDTASLNSAASTVGSAGGGILLLPSGITAIAGTVAIPANVTLRGKGIGRTTIRSRAGAAGANPIVRILASDSALEDLTVDINSRTGCIGVVVAPTVTGQVIERVTIRRIRVSGSTSDAIRVPDVVAGFTFTESLIEDCVRGFVMYAPAAGLVSTGILITGNRFRRVGDVNIQLYGGNDPASIRFAGAIIANNDLREFAQTGANGPIPIEPTGIRDLVVANNIIVGPSTRGVSMGNNRNTTVVGNVVREQSTYAFELNGGTNYTISGNTVERCTSLAHDTSATAAQLTDVLIIGNTFADTAATAAVSGGDILKFPQSRRVRIIGNTFTDWRFVRSCVRIGEGAAPAEDCLVEGNTFTNTANDTPISTIVVRKAVRAVVRNNIVRVVRDLVAADDLSTAIGINTDSSSVDILLEGNEVTFIGAITAVATWAAGIGNGNTGAAAYPVNLRVVRNRVRRATVGIRLVTTDPAMRVRDNELIECTLTPLGADIRTALTGIQGSASLTFPAIAAGGTAERTITVTGAVAGDAVLLGPPAAFEAGLISSGRVTAANTVTVRVFNSTAASVTPAVATWNASVVRV